MIRIPYLREALSVALLLAAGWFGWEWRDRSADVAIAEIQADANGKMAEMAKAEAAAQAKAREAEQAKATAVALADAEYQRGLKDAKQAAADIVADLGADRLRLRDEWAGCETDRVSGAATAARLADDLARLRRESAGRIIQAADEADAQVRGLQAVIEADRN